MTQRNGTAQPSDGERNSSALTLWQRFKAWWTSPIVVKVETRQSPDWEGDAARYREERGW